MQSTRMMMKLRAAAFGQSLKWAAKRTGDRAVVRRSVQQVSVAQQRPATAVVGALSLFTDDQHNRRAGSELVAVLLSSVLGMGYMATQCESTAKDDLTPAHVAKEDFQELVKSHDVDSMPVYTLEDVAKRNGDGGSRIWMTYGGVVYDVTDFIDNHPGGSEKIMSAAGSAIEPFW